LYPCAAGMDAAFRSQRRAATPSSASSAPRHDRCREAAGGGTMGTETSIVWALCVGLAGLVGSGALATGIGWVAQVACAWCGVSG
jgi:hypothetical protein